MDSTTDSPRMGLADLWRQERELKRVVLCALALYLLATATLLGLRLEHVVLTAAAASCALWGGGALRFLRLFAPVVLTGIVYDFSRLTTGWRGEVHIADVYATELAWFGVGSGSARRIPAEALLDHTHVVLDAVSGVAYLVYLYVPIVVAIALYFARDERRMFDVGAAFLFSYLIGLVIYLVYPTAPPWYVFEHGLGSPVLDATPSAAGAARFDVLLGYPYFASFYARSANVFGAMPSLHVAAPASTLLAVAGKRPRWWLPVAIVLAAVTFAAVYLQHHYVLDLLAGLACAVVGYAIARLVRQRCGGALA